KKLKTDDKENNRKDKIKNEKKLKTDDKENNRKDKIKNTVEDASYNSSDLKILLN
ncbi:hypothetical protein JGH11_10500, partial [Dysgonomonas sp. Marseille-P4677]|nr:hypothetical protein [Dysgonomonas sp. Marseille-P4677]